MLQTRDLWFMIERTFHAPEALWTTHPLVTFSQRRITEQKKRQHPPPPENQKPKKNHYPLGNYHASHF